MSKTAVILRGPAGCGKSAYAERNFEGVERVSADNFFMRRNDESVFEYRFDPTLLGVAHAECFARFLDLLYAGRSVVVDNTNIQQWEYANYVRVAEACGYEVVIVEFRPRTINDIKLCHSRNTHGVPLDTVARMCLNFQPDPRAEVQPISDGNTET